MSVGREHECDEDTDSWYWDKDVAVNAGLVNIYVEMWEDKKFRGIHESSDSG